jgi:DNA-binding MarR family transcriptional regulator
MKQSTARSAPSIEGAEDPGRLLFTLMHVARALEDRLEAGLEQCGLSMAKYGVLSELVKADEPLSLSELAARLSCVRSNMTQLVDRLEADGLVRRVNDPDDRRTVRAALTTAGRSQEEAGSLQLQAVQAHFAVALPERDRAQLHRVLASLG